MAEADKISVELAYALPQQQKILLLQVSPGTTAEQLVAQSNIEQYFPELQTEGAKLGVFGQAVQGSYVVQAGDRVEIYRPLLADPKLARKQRAAAKQRRRENAVRAAPERRE